MAKRTVKIPCDLLWRRTRPGFTVGEPDPSQLARLTAWAAANGCVYKEPTIDFGTQSSSWRFVFQTAEQATLFKLFNG